MHLALDTSCGWVQPGSFFDQKPHRHSIYAWASSQEIGLDGIVKKALEKWKPFRFC